jgi:hypothetical protein
VISQAILVKLRDGPLAKVRAPGAAWIPLASLEPEMWFEDGYHTVQTMVARLEDRY